MMRRIRPSWLLGLCAAAGLLLFPAAVDAGPYGSGSYGVCTYGNCGISLSSSATVTANIIPGSATVCSLSSGSVTVSSDASSGYTLTLGDTDTDNHMTGTGGGAVAAIAGSQSNPLRLTANTWGYRVDGQAGFGAGPTSALSNGTIPTSNFAAVPTSGATPDTIATTTSAANPPVTSTVWYGICAATTIPSGTYSDSVTYTAVTN